MFTLLRRSTISLITVAALFVTTPAATAQLRSAGNGTPVPVTFTNGTKSTVDLFWIDFQGNDVFYGTIQPGQKYIQPSAPGHAWRARTSKQDGGQVVGTYVATTANPQAHTFAAAPPPPRSESGLVLTEQGIGPVNFTRGLTFTTEDLLRAFPDHRVSLFVTKGLIHATITTVETYQGEKLFSIYSYIKEEDQTWNTDRPVDAVEVHSAKIIDRFGAKVGMTYADLRRIHGTPPQVERGEGDTAYLKAGPFTYGLSYPKNRGTDAPPGQTMKEITSGAAKVDSLLWPGAIY